MKVKVLNVSEYVSKKTGKKSWRVTGLGNDGNVVVFFRPEDEAPKAQDEYAVKLVYSSYDLNYKVTYEKQ